MKFFRGWRTVSLVFLASLLSIVAAGASVATATPAAAASTPSCTFNGSSFPIVTGVTQGGTVQVDCTGMEPLHPYLFIELSLVVALDPSTAALLSGTVSPSLLLSVLSALPMINPSALEVTTSDLSGNLDYSYKTPTNQALDPNASCAPSTEEFNSGLLGCAMAIVDLTTANEVGAGDAILEYKGFPLFPPNPTLAVSPAKVAPGGAVTVSDATAATTYWWVATLSELDGDEGGGTPTPPTATVTIAGVPGNPANTISVAPAVYNGSTFTPPVLSGGFTMPSPAAKGVHKVTVDYAATLEGFPLGIVGKSTIKITK
jgi:hypothetical protein